MKPRLFISYRHSDSAADARQIGNALKKKFGKHNVFIDVSGVGDGQDINEITHALKKTDIVIAVIGRNWVGKPWTAPDSALSKSEIWNEDDWVRKELYIANSLGLIIIPVLVDGITASDLKSIDIPPTLEFLRDRKSITLRHESWDDDLDGFVASIPKKNRPIALFAVVAVVCVGAWFGYKYFLPPISEPDMVKIPAGQYVMGSDPTQDPSAEPDEQPPHKIVIEQPFWIGKYEVTFEEYDTFARATGRNLPGDEGWGRGTKPVINVSWDDAVAYAKWLSEQTGKRYRLPTEAEWEYAARAGTETPYWWGDDVGTNNANCNGCGSQWDNQKTAPVGSFDPNPFGLFDTAGNVYEWVQDCWHGNYESASADGSAWEGRKDCASVTRGGSWNDKPQWARSANRGRYYRVNSGHHVGFRLARSKCLIEFGPFSLFCPKQ